MAGFIEVSDTRSWSTANWVYWGLMDHVIEALSGDPDAVRSVEGCKWMHLLSLPTLLGEDPVVAEKVLETLKSVARRCAEGELVCNVEGRPVDDASQVQFREAANELISILDGT